MTNRGFAMRQETRHPRSTPFSPMIRALMMLTLLGVLGLLTAPIADAAPITIPSSDSAQAIPSALQKYDPESSMWKTAPWMTSPTCKDKNGDFSIWAAEIVADTPELLSAFQPGVFGADANPRDKAILQGYRDLAGQVRSSIPAGYCVADLTRWAGPAQDVKPFGFAWGQTAGDGHQSMYSCTDRASDTAGEPEATRFTGAERAMCDAFYVSCANAPDVEKNRCEVWNTWSDDYARRVDELRGKAIDAFPGVARGEFRETPGWGGLLAVGVVLIAVAVLLTAGKEIHEYRTGSAKGHGDAHS